MPTPVGHVFGALVLSTSQKKRLDTLSIVLVLFFALLPDIDFLFGFPIGNPNRYHHLFTHSFTFVVAAGMLGGYIYGKLGQKSVLYSSALFVSAGITHVILDTLALDQRAPYGCCLFWPFSNQFIISPVVIFSDVSRASDSQTFFSSLINIHNLKTVLLEVVILAPLWGVLEWWKRKRRV